MSAEHPAHDGPCLHGVDDLTSRVPWGICDDCARVVVPANRGFLVEASSPAEAMRQVLEHASRLAAAGGACGTCGQPRGVLQ